MILFSLHFQVTTPRRKNMYFGYNYRAEKMQHITSVIMERLRKLHQHFPYSTPSYVIVPDRTFYLKVLIDISAHIRIFQQ